MRIRIIAMPDGEAPERVREEWIGCEFQCSKVNEGVTLFSDKWMSYPGYAVYYKDAITALAHRNPEAAHWWDALWLQKWDRAPIARLIFDAECCEVIPD